MNKLPRIFKCSNDKVFKNNKSMCFVSEDNFVYDNEKGVTEVLDEIFSGFGYSYNIPVVIKTTSKVYDTFLFIRTKNSVVTTKNEVIPINDIISIHKKKY